MDVVDIRGLGRMKWGGTPARWMDELNARHPWSHNDAFHPWILTRLPSQRRDAVDVGCGRGDLLAALAPNFEHVRGIDVDAAMRVAASARCAGLSNVDVSESGPEPNSADLVTMIAVLHHLELIPALTTVREALRPGGRFLCVGLALPSSWTDQAWDVASMVTNPVIGFIRRPWPTSEPRDRDLFPVAAPTGTIREIQAGLAAVMPGATLRRHLGFRHTIEWSKPT